MSTPDMSDAPGSPTAISKSYRLYVLILLTAVYTFNFIDRQIIGIISPAIKADLGLSDGELGFLKGIAFAILYTTLGIPIARLADRWNRVSIISISLACWSGFTAISGYAQNFVQLALARVGVGVGEAGGSPPSHSIISDLYPKEERAGALAIFALGIPIGITLAYLGGGWVVTNLGWRMTFIAVGLPGIMLAIILKLTVKEPVRGAAETGLTKDAFQDIKIESKNPVIRELTILWRAARHLLAIPSYRLVVISLTAASFSSYAISGWIVDFFDRSHPDFGFSNVVLWLGLINGTAYILGVFVGGQLVDKLSAKNRRAYGLIPALGLLLTGPFFIAAMWLDNPIWSMICWWPVHLLTGFYLGPCFALAQTLAPISIRALSTAIFFFILNMIALGFGPTYVGYASDILANNGMGEEMGLRVALTSALIGSLIGMVAFYRLSQTVDADWDKATQ